MKKRFPKVYSLLRRIAILREGRRLGYEFKEWIKDNRQKHILDKRLGETSADQLSHIRDRVYHYAEKLKAKGEPAGRYYYSAQGKTPILYASVYSALLYDLLDKVGELNIHERLEWVDYINSFQCEDGLYRDPLLDNDIAESIDWWGWRHLSAHVVSAITALGGKTRYPFCFLNFLYGTGRAYRWIKELPWRENDTNVSNTVMNYGVLLQYERDFWHSEQAGTALAEIFAFLDENVNSEVGLWYWPKPANSQELSDAVQTSYHLWNLYFYEKRTIPFIEKAIDNCLATQNRFGGFGVQYNSSACEDIDSIDPLCRFYFLTNYRHAEIENCLKKAFRWVAVNQMNDGGFVFRRFVGFQYGHELMETSPEESHLFATWFRMLSIAYMGQVLEVPLSTGKLRLSLHCPGYQFWNDWSE
jgi:hypothetical protein